MQKLAKVLPGHSKDDKKDKEDKKEKDNEQKNQPQSGNAEHVPGSATSTMMHGGGYNSEDLIVFVNGKSGGGQGVQILQQLPTLLSSNSYYYDLSHTSPDDAWKNHKDRLKHYKILACGGDGTGRWVLESLDRLRDVKEKPPVAVLPLGTGNDIGRILGWGGGYTGESLGPILNAVRAADGVKLDRWQIEMKSEGSKDSSYSVMNNYLSIGFADAKIALQFHEMREKHKDLFVHRTINKLTYLGIGLKDALGGVYNGVTGDYSSYLTNDLVELEINGKAVDLKGEVEGIVILNLPSYAGGMDLWGPVIESHYKPVSFNDGLFEIIGIRNAAHVAQIGMSLQNGVRLGQANNVRIKVKSQAVPMPMKIDGEPWMQKDPVEINIKFLNQGNMLMANRPWISPLALQPEERAQMYKLGNTMPKQWKSRLFCLKDHRLYYYVDQNSLFPNGMIDLKLVTGTQEDKSSNARSNTFILNTKERDWLIQANSRNELNQWVNLINSKISQFSLMALPPTPNGQPATALTGAYNPNNLNNHSPQQYDPRHPPGSEERRHHHHHRHDQSPSPVMQSPQAQQQGSQHQPILQSASSSSAPAPQHVPPQIHSATSPLPQRHMSAPSSSPSPQPSPYQSPYAHAAPVQQTVVPQSSQYQLMPGAPQHPPQILPHQSHYAAPHPQQYAMMPPAGPPSQHQPPHYMHHSYHSAPASPHPSQYAMMPPAGPQYSPYGSPAPGTTTTTVVHYYYPAPNSAPSSPAPGLQHPQIPMNYQPGPELPWNYPFASFKPYGV